MPLATFGRLKLWGYPAWRAWAYWTFHRHARIIMGGARVVGEIGDVPNAALPGFLSDIRTTRAQCNSKNDDDMPGPRAMNVAIFLDEVNEFNGPLMFIPSRGRAKPGTDVRSSEA